MKILLCGSFAPSALENYYVEGLSRLNIEVEKFNIRDQYYDAINRSALSKVINKVYPGIYYTPVNNGLLSFISGRDYDVILIFKGFVLFPETIQQLKDHCKLLVCYNPDHPFRFYSPGSGNSNIERSIRHYDLYLTYSKQIGIGIKDMYNVDSAVVPFGYDDLFAGSHNKVNSLPWVFVGAYDKERENFIEQLHGFDIFIFGDTKWKSRSRSEWTKKRYQGKPVYGNEYLSIITNSRGMFNLLRTQNIVEDSHNMRTFEVPGAGGVLIANRTTEQREFFEEDKEAIFFDSIEELKDKISFYNKNQHLLEIIKISAYNRSVNSNYGYSFRSRQLINEISIRLK